MTPSQMRYQEALGVLLATPVMREFFWRFLVENCLITQAGFALNASAYALLAKQEIGKRLLADAKAVNPEGVYRAEREYDELLKHMENLKQEGS